MHLFEIDILIFNFLLSSTCFEPGVSSSRRRLYIQLWYSVWYTHYMDFGIYTVYTILCLYVKPSPWRQTIVSKRVEDIKNLKMKIIISKRCILLVYIVQSDTKKGNFWKPQQKLKKSKKKKLLTKIETLQLAF